MEFETGRARLQLAWGTSLPFSLPPIYSSSRPFSNSLSVSSKISFKASPFLSPSLGELEFVSVGSQTKPPPNTPPLWKSLLSPQDSEIPSSSHPDDPCFCSVLPRPSSVRLPLRYLTADPSVPALASPSPSPQFSLAPPAFPTGLSWSGRSRTCGGGGGEGWRSLFGAQSALVSLVTQHVVLCPFLRSLCFSNRQFEFPAPRTDWES